MQLPLEMGFCVTLFFISFYCLHFLYIYNQKNQIKLFSLWENNLVHLSKPVTHINFLGRSLMRMGGHLLIPLMRVFLLCALLALRWPHEQLQTRTALSLLISSWCPSPPPKATSPDNNYFSDSDYHLQFPQDQSLELSKRTRNLA